MTPAEGLAHLAALPPSSIKMGLGRVREALDRLGNPERRFPALHVAGTNGKGSTCAITASCLQTRYRTGLYTSPHLVRPNERIQINGEEIDDQTFGKRIAEVVTRLGVTHELTYFELGTVVAFWHFAEERVDIAVIETGLGGRLDATTACTPQVTCVTPISFDHMEYLGHTLEAIGREKAGIFKPGVPIVLSRQPVTLPTPPDTQVFHEGRDFEVVDGQTYRGWGRRLNGLQLPLKGPHQRQNLAVALACLEALTAFPLTDEQLQQGVKTARWPGRLEELPGSPLVVLDGAHNPAGVEVLLQALEAEYAGRQVELVFGVFADKDSEPMMRALFPRVTSVHLTPLASPRSKAPEQYLSLAQSLNSQVFTYPDSARALEAAQSRVRGNGLVLAAGSLFLVGELRGQWLRRAR